MLLRNIFIRKVGFIEDTVVGNMVEKDVTKRQGYIAPHDIMKTRDFIVVMGFPG